MCQSSQQLLSKELGNRLKRVAEDLGQCQELVKALESRQALYHHSKAVSEAAWLSGLLCGDIKKKGRFEESGFVALQNCEAMTSIITKEDVQCHARRHQ